MQSKNVVMIESQGFVGFEGTYPRMLNTAKCLLRKSYEVLVIGWDRDCSYPPSESVEGIRVERIGIRAGDMRGPINQFLPMTMFLVKAFWKLIKYNFTVLHCHNIDVLPLSYVVSRIKKAKLIFEAHEPDYYAFWPKKWHVFLRIIQSLEKYFSKRADYVIVTNSYQVEKYRNSGIENIVLIGNYPVNSIILEELPEEKFLREDLFIGRVGTIYQGTGIEEIIQAFQRLLERHKNIKLYFAGRILKGYTEEFNRLIDPIRDKVIVAGAYHSNDIQMHYQKIDISIMPYRKSTWFKNSTPSKLFDSLANGVPVITTDIGGVGDVLKKYNCGIMVEDGDIIGIERAVESLIVDVKLRKKMAQNGLEAIKEEYNWNLMEERLIKVYDEL
jgi:glycosyltransferase involved in cell wall biosynthesis